MGKVCKTNRREEAVSNDKYGTFVDETYGKDKTVSPIGSEEQLGNYLASAIMVHFTFGSDKYDAPSSAGCLTVESDDYTNFAHSVGFITDDSPDIIYKGSGGTMIEGVTGYIIVDRSIAPW